MFVRDYKLTMMVLCSTYSLYSRPFYLEYPSLSAAQAPLLST